MIKKLALIALFTVSLYGKNVLIFNSYHPTFSWTKKQVDAINRVLTNSGEKIDIYIEYMDTKRNSLNGSYKHKLLRLLKYKYVNKNIDVVISTDDNAIKFLKEYRNELFSKSKIVFCGVNDLKILDDYHKNDITGVFEKMTPYKNYQIAKMIAPNLKKLYLIGDNSVTFNVLKTIFINELSNLDIEFEFVSNRNIDIVAKQLELAQENSMGLFVMPSSYIDSNNQIITMQEAIRRINNAYQNPIISSAKVFNQGGKVIGGYVVDGQKQGELAAKLALAVMRNNSRLQLAPILNGTNSYVFDYDALKYFGIDIDSYKFDDKIQVLNRPVTFYEYYKQTLNILMVFAASFFVIFLISIIYTYRLRKVNTKLEKSYKNVQLFIDSILEAVIISKNGICIDVNEEAVKLLNYNSKEELIGKEFMNFIPASQKSFIKERLGFSEAKPEETLLLTQDEREVEVLSMSKNINIHEGIVNVSSFVDLRESKSKDKILFEQSKLASMGEMIGNIAHQWRQPLSAISTAASGVKLQKELGLLEEEVLYESLGVIIKNTMYLSQTIDDFKNYIKGDKNIETFPVSMAVDNTLHLLNAAFRNNHIRVIKNYDDVEILSCNNEIVQVLINILNNAKDALVMNCDEEDRVVFINISQNSDDQVFINIKDSGGGIDENILDKIFEPYFTTKNKSQGTGLGLYMSYNLVSESLGGTMLAGNCNFIFNNEEYYGAEIKVILPKEISREA